MIYAWIWRKLPGPKWLKVVEAMVLILIVALTLWFGIFPNVQNSITGDPSL